MLCSGCSDLSVICTFPVSRSSSSSSFAVSSFCSLRRLLSRPRARPRWDRPRAPGKLRRGCLMTRSGSFSFRCIHAQRAKICVLIVMQKKNVESVTANTVLQNRITLSIPCNHGDQQERFICFVGRQKQWRCRREGWMCETPLSFDWGYGFLKIGERWDESFGEWGKL